MQFEIPVAVFLFRRTNTLKLIFERISRIKPGKLYLIADGGRNENEQAECVACRNYAESLVTWECEIITNYAKNNRGVFHNIGMGAEWVLSQEKYCIFLEDDNLPEESFFYFCEELLHRYENTPQILWICGTNYLGEYNNSKEESYMFTKHMLPCGWASWSSKFLKYYDGKLTGLQDKNKVLNFKKSYMIKGCKSKSLYRSHLYHTKRTKYLVAFKPKEASWDYQMNFAARANKMYGISPKKNQIKNIGVDNFSIHGGNSINLVSTHCGMDSFTLEFPLIHPQHISVDKEYEKHVNQVLKPSRFCNLSHIIAIPIKKILGLNRYDSLKNYLQKRGE